MNDKNQNEKILNTLSAISHEIQTPVNLIAATASLVGYKLEDDFVKEYMENIINNCNKLTMLISNITSSNLTSLSNKEYVNIHQFIENFSKTLIPYCKDAGADFKTKISAENDFLYLPVITIERILLNLITNAIKYNDKSKKSIKLTITANEENIIFSVKDNGIGIAEENIDKVTEKFYRIDETSSNGLGLGLSLIKDYLQEINGTMTIKSKIKKGTEVTVSIPLENQDTTFSVKESEYEYIPEKANFDIEFSQFKNQL